MATSDGASPYDRYSALSQVSMSPNVPNISTGNPMVDQMISLLLSGSNIAPRPNRGQGVYDAYMQRQRSQEFIESMRGGMNNSPISQKLGGLSPQFAQIAAIISGGPDGLMNHPLMRAANGGNYLKAQMGLMSNLSGMTNTMGYGTTGNISAFETNRMMQSLTAATYHMRQTTQKDLDKVKGGMNADLDSYIGTHKDDLAGILTTGNKGKRTIDPAKLEKARQDTKDFTESLQTGLTDAALKAYKEVFDKQKSLNGLQSKLGELLPDKLDFTKTRGFESQDITKSFTMAIDRGLFQAGKYAQSNSKGSDKGLGKWVESMGVLRATADLTGTESGEDSLSALSDIFGGVGEGGRGGSRLDLGDKSDRDGAEKLLRDFKGAAYAAGASVEAVLGINREVKALASRFPSLQYMGGFGSMKTSISALQQTQALAAAMGQGYVRQQGGTQTMLQDQASLIVKNKGEKVSQQAYALWEEIESHPGLSQAQKDAAHQIILDHATGDKKYSGMSGISKMWQDIGNITGQSMYQVQAASNDTQMAARAIEREGKFGLHINGTRLEQDLGNATAQGTTVQQYRAVLSQFAFQNLKGTNRYRDIHGKVLNDVDEMMGDFEWRMGNRGSTGETIEQIRAAAGILGKGVDFLFDESDPIARDGVNNYTNWAVATHNKAYKESMIMNRAIAAKHSAASTEFASRYAKLQSPILQNFMQEVMSGGLAKGFDGFIDILTDGKAKDRTRDIMGSVKSMMQEGSDASIFTAFKQLHGGFGDLKANLQGEGMSEADIAKVIAQNGALSGEGDISFIDKISQDLTLNQILDGANDDKWGNSKAKQLGKNQDDLKRAAKLLTASGLADQRTIDQFGNKHFDRKNMELALAKQSLFKSVEIQDRALAKEQETRIGSEVSDMLNSPGGGKYRDIYRLAGLIDDKDKLSSAGLTDLAKPKKLEIGGVYDELTGEKFRKSDGSIDFDKLKEALGSNDTSLISEEARGALANMPDHFLELDSTGKVKKVNDFDKLKKEIEKERAQQDVLSNPLLREGITEYGARMTDYEKRQGELGGVTANEKLEDILKNFQTSLTNNVDGIAECVASIVAALNRIQG